MYDNISCRTTKQWPALSRRLHACKMGSAHSAQCMHSSKDMLNPNVYEQSTNTHIHGGFRDINVNFGTRPRPGVVNRMGKAGMLSINRY